MRSILPALPIIITAIAGSARAQPGAIGLLPDQTFTSCDLVDDAPGIVQIYVFHAFTAGVRASQFAIVDWGTNLTYLSWVPAHGVSIGTNPYEGVAVTYDAGCVAGPILVGTISYLSTGTSGPCGGIQTVADPGSRYGSIEGVNCAFQTTFPGDGVLGINGCGGRATIGENMALPFNLKETDS